MRYALAALAVVLSTLLVPIGITATWLSLRVDSTEAYVDTVAPLAEDPDLREVLAREVADAQDPSQAAIAPRLAAEIYGLDILAENVEDEEHNTTRFVVLSRDLIEAPSDNGPVVTSFIFNVRNLPGALYKALGGFATNGVNMTKLESYMVGGMFSATQFLAEVDGHPDEPGLKRALEELRFFTTEIKILGVYPADPFRIEHA